MASPASARVLLVLLCSSTLLISFVSPITAAEDDTIIAAGDDTIIAAVDDTIASGLAFGFYQDACPSVEWIVRSSVAAAIRKDKGIAAGLIRIIFHDCFVQGCDGSVLLTGPNSEQKAPPNLTLRPEALQLISDISTLVQSSCGPAVSCADITTMAARDAVFLSGGPYYDVPLGRRDSAAPSSLTGNLPSPVSDVSTLISFFQRQGLSVTDLVTLSGAHTVGIGQCSSFSNRLPPTGDPTIDPIFAQELQATCPNGGGTNNFTNLDKRTPNRFDNKYYVDLVNKQGLFTSDEGLFFDSRTSWLVTRYAKYHQLFFNQFAASMVKMSQLNVLTGNNGQIRLNCAAANSVAGDDEGYAAAE